MGSYDFISEPILIVICLKIDDILDFYPQMMSEKLILFSRDTQLEIFRHLYIVTFIPKGQHLGIFSAQPSGHKVTRRV